MDSLLLAEKLSRFQKAKFRLIELKEAYELFDAQKAQAIMGKIEMLNNRILAYKVEFDAQFKDVQAKNQAFKQDFDKGYTVSFHKTPFEDTIETYKAQIGKLDKIPNNVTFCAILCGILDLKGLTRVKKYAFKLAYYATKRDDDNFVKTLEAYERLKVNNKARMAGIQRSNSRKVSRKFKEAEADTEQDWTEEDEFND